MSASSYQADEGGPFQVIYLTDYDTGSTYSALEAIASMLRCGEPAMGATTLISKAASVLDMVTVVALCLTPCKVAYMLPPAVAQAAPWKRKEACLLEQ
ncbi:hypothetical protein N7508_009017 [Penicillium antarcticum]|uniref:uncharacterized protein n=1 Tax=Penicillium antarcticum TaxID=416450 RepID=UPI002390C483|nr:uncharacterized protein N7508_009017 [Penicillium antarcticum]KAJ5294196.1 hypothetical protein N7508_009017 [Penicillium antarcticum]